MGENERRQESVGRAEEPKYDPEHLRILTEEGIEVWNRWSLLEMTPTVTANLEGAVLNHADLRDAAFSEANCAGTEFRSANLERANFFKANLEGASPSNANLRRANLLAANLQGASLVRANLEGARLYDADLTRADLQGANLKGASLELTNLEGADLRGVKGLSLHNTFIRDAQFDARARDRWSQLRQNYTGPRMLFTFLFLALFFIPFTGRTAGWVLANRAQTEVSLTISELEAGAVALESQDPTAAPLLRTITESARKRIPWENPGEWNESTVWRLVLGFERGWSYLLTGLALLLFNIFRAFLTFVVAPMRDAEERSGWSPSLKPAKKGRELVRDPGALLEAYGWLWWPHRAVQALFWVSVGSFLYHGWHWLTLPVWIPA